MRKVDDVLKCSYYTFCTFCCAKKDNMWGKWLMCSSAKQKLFDWVVKQEKWRRVTSVEPNFSQKRKRRHNFHRKKERTKIPKKLRKRVVCRKKFSLKRKRQHNFHKEKKGEKSQKFTKKGGMTKFLKKTIRRHNFQR